MWHCKWLRALCFSIAIIFIEILLHPEGIVLSFEQVYELLVLCYALGVINKGGNVRGKSVIYAALLYFSGTAMVFGVFFLQPNIWTWQVLFCATIELVFNFKDKGTGHPF